MPASVPPSARPASLPLIVAARVAFAFAFAACLLTIWTLAHLVHALPGFGSKRDRNGYSIIISQRCFRWIMLAPCWPWIRLLGLSELRNAWFQVADAGTPYVLANHNSMMDSLLITALIPPSIAYNLRSLIKLALFHEPIFGYICKAVGHFPVYFTGTTDGNFSVDKEAQAKVTQEMDDFISSNGGLVIFPEGQLNSHPRTLQPFRRGAFALPMKHKKPIWGFLNVGCDYSWPKGQPIGGFPSAIHVKLFKICDDASSFPDTAAIAEHAQACMQRELDIMYSSFDAAHKQKDA